MELSIFRKFLNQWMDCPVLSLIHQKWVRVLLFTVITKVGEIHIRFFFFWGGRGHCVLTMPSTDTTRKFEKQKYHMTWNWQPKAKQNLQYASVNFWLETKQCATAGVNWKLPTKKRKKKKKNKKQTSCQSSLNDHYIKFCS